MPSSPPAHSAVTFIEFDRQIGAVATWIGQRTRRGDRVAVIADNGAAYARLYYGVPRCGRILVLINQRLGPGEQAAQLASADPTVLLGDARYLSALPDLARQVPGLQHVVDVNGAQWQRAERDSAIWRRPGRPRRARVAPVHQRIDRARRRASCTPTGRSPRRSAARVAGRSVEPGGVYLLPFPMCHVAGYNMLVHHAAHSTVLPVAAFRPDDVRGRRERVRGDVLLAGADHAARPARLPRGVRDRAADVARHRLWVRGHPRRSAPTGDSHDSTSASIRATA